MKNIRLTSALFTGLTALSVSCKKNDNNSTPSYSVPSTYTFANVDYKESAARVSMWNGYQGHLGKGSLRQLNQDTVNNLWNNTNSVFTAETAGGIPYTYDVLNKLSFTLAGKSADAAVLKSFADS